MLAAFSRALVGLVPTRALHDARLAELYGRPPDRQWQRSLRRPRDVWLDEEGVDNNFVFPSPQESSVPNVHDQIDFGLEEESSQPVAIFSDFGNDHTDDEEEGNIPDLHAATCAASTSVEQGVNWRFGGRAGDA